MQQSLGLLYTTRPSNMLCKEITDRWTHRHSELTISLKEMFAFASLFTLLSNEDCTFALNLNCPMSIALIAVYVQAIFGGYMIYGVISGIDKKVT